MIARYTVIARYTLPSGWARVDDFTLCREDGLTVACSAVSTCLTLGVPAGEWCPTPEEWEAVWRLSGQSQGPFQPPAQGQELAFYAPPYPAWLEAIDRNVARRISKATASLESDNLREVQSTLDDVRDLVDRLERRVLALEATVARGGRLP